ncbi:unnamed protein product [Ilex paraguariensis]|uniref:WIYLD domain-containing protein n=1 Tax=Ilex paraguariensis TaxID=185542 RepID=A0ABC8QY29_9AQUA
MEPRAEIRRACHAMKKYGFHHMTVKAILKELLPAHNYNWELIENDDYTILLDAMFEWKNRNIKSKVGVFTFALHVYIFLQVRRGAIGKHKSSSGSRSHTCTIPDNLETAATVQAEHEKYKPKLKI